MPYCFTCGKEIYLVLPLYELSRLIRQAEAELEEMRKNPEVSKEEITEVERELARHKAEFEERIEKLRR